MDDSPAQVPPVRHDFEPDVEIVLEPVDSVVVTTLVNVAGRGLVVITGWRAQHAMSGRFPAAFVPNAVGTSFYL